MVNLMVSKILITGGEKKYITHAKGNDKMVRVPFSLYVEWNDEFKDLYDVDLVVLPEDLEVKYGLPRKVKISGSKSFTDQQNSIGRLDKVGKIFHVLKKLSESSHLQTIQTTQLNHPKSIWRQDFGLGAFFYAPSSF